MITRGSKYFFGAAVVGYLTALLYGIITSAATRGGFPEVITEGGIVEAVVGPISFGWMGGVGEQIGYSTLMCFTGVMAVLGAFTSAFRDGSPEAIAQVSGGTVENGAVSGGVDLRVTAPAGLSYWPLLGAFSMGALIVGASMSTTLFLIGIGGLVVVMVEWTVRAWSERATGDPAVNKAVRDRFMYPIEVPVAATLGIALVIFSMSRILLAISKLGAVFMIIFVASAIFAVAVVLANRPDLKRSMMVGALLVGGVLIIGGGIAGGLVGPRDSDHHEESLTAVVSVADDERADEWSLVAD